MNIIDASCEIIQAHTAPMEAIERIGRVCYKSEGKITGESAVPFCKRIIDSQHESVLEHASMSVRFVVDRGVSHELVRHRLASFSQESTRYVNYGKRGLTFVRPCFGWIEGSTLYRDWIFSMEQAEYTYLRMIGAGAKPEEARSILPNSLKTELVMTANMREWRHVLKLRTSPKAHPQMREVMLPLLSECKQRWHVLFAGI